MDCDLSHNGQVPAKGEFLLSSLLMTGSSPNTPGQSPPERIILGAPLSRSNPQNSRFRASLSPKEDDRDRASVALETMVIALDTCLSQVLMLMAFRRSFVTVGLLLEKGSSETLSIAIENLVNNSEASARCPRIHS
jgi:hypothetical protein